MDRVHETRHVCRCYNVSEVEWYGEQRLQSEGVSMWVSSESSVIYIVQDALSRNFRGGLPVTLLYADDPILMADTEELLVEKNIKCKDYHILLA